MTKARRAWRPERRSAILPAATSMRQEHGRRIMLRSTVRAGAVTCRRTRASNALARSRSLSLRTMAVFLLISGCANSVPAPGNAVTSGSALPTPLAHEALPTISPAVLSVVGDGSPPDAPASAPDGQPDATTKAARTPIPDATPMPGYAVGPASNMRQSEVSASAAAAADAQQGSTTQDRGESSATSRTTTTSSTVPPGMAGTPESTETSGTSDQPSAAPPTPSGTPDRSALPTAPRVPPVADVNAVVHTLPGVAHTWQKWNNCGPSATMMALSAFGVTEDQLAIAAVLKPDREDTNVSPEEIARYIESRGLRADVRWGGTPALARAAVRAGMPLVAEQWIGVDGRGEMGHYRVVTGYDDASSEVVAMDSYYGPSQRYAAAAFAAMWQPFLGAYVLVYDPSQSDLARAVLGEDADPAANEARVAQQVRAFADAHPQDAWAHYALGESLARRGRHDEAVAAFERAIAIGLPFRAFWYQFGYAESLHALGRNEQLLAQADVTLAPMKGENLEEWQFWRGRALEGLGRREEAREAYQRALFFQPSFAPASQALQALGAP